MQLEASLKQTQELYISQELSLAIKLLSLNEFELKKEINKEAMENVMIEFVEQNTREELSIFQNFYQSSLSCPTEKNFFEKKDLDPQIYRDTEACLYDYLRLQVNLQKFSPILHNIALLLIREIDDKGYFIGDLETLAQELNQPIHLLEEILEIIQGFDPAGIGARDLKECLLLQTQDPLQRKIISYHLEDLAKNKIELIGKSLGISLEETYKISNQIKNLNPFPGSSYYRPRETIYIQPEIFIFVKKNKLQVQIPNLAKSSFKISSFYMNLLENSQGELKDYLIKKAKRAFFIKKALEERQKNIEKVVKKLSQIQAGFFLHNQSLLPLTMEELAKKCELSESTVSRITDNKFLQCQQGIFSLKVFFPNGLTSQSGQVSTPFVKQLIKNLINEENSKKPLSDQKITNLLNETNGINIKRRTVAKYREEMGIPSSSKRKILI